MRKLFINFPDVDLAYFPEHTEYFDDFFSLNAKRFPAATLNVPGRTGDPGSRPENFAAASRRRQSSSERPLCADLQPVQASASVRVDSQHS
jgi:hypothetical protein